MMLTFQVFSPGTQWNLISFVHVWSVIFKFI